MLHWINVWNRSNTFHSDDDAAIDATKLSIQISLKYLITENSEKKDLLVLL